MERDVHMMEATYGSRYGARSQSFGQQPPKRPRVAEWEGVLDDTLDINTLMTDLHAKQSRQVIVPYFGRYKLPEQRGVWQVIRRGPQRETWLVAPYEHDDPQKIDDNLIRTVHASDLNFPRNTLLTHIDWHKSAFVDGAFRRDRIQRFDIDETCSCEVTVGEDPTTSRVIIYASSTLNEGSAVHAPQKAGFGAGAESMLKDCTIVTMYWKGTSNKAPWRIEAPRRIFALISEIVEMHKAYCLRGLLMGCVKPDIWGFSRGAMTVIAVLRQFTPFAGSCFRCATLVAPYFAKTWRNTCIYPYIFDDLGDCPVRIVLGERDSWFQSANSVIETFVQYQRSKSHLFHERLDTHLGQAFFSFREMNDRWRSEAKARKPRREMFQDVNQFNAAMEKYAKEKIALTNDLEMEATAIHCKLDMSAWWRGKLTIIYVRDSDHDQAWQRLMSDMTFAQMLLLEKDTLERVILESQRQVNGEDFPQACVLRGCERGLLKNMADIGEKLTEIDGARGESSRRIAQREIYEVFSQGCEMGDLQLLPPHLTKRLAAYLEQRKDDSLEMSEEDARLCEDYFTYDGGVCFAFRGNFELKATSNRSKEAGTALREVNRLLAEFSMVP